MAQRRIRPVERRLACERLKRRPAAVVFARGIARCRAICHGVVLSVALELRELSAGTGTRPARLLGDHLQRGEPRSPLISLEEPRVGLLDQDAGRGFGVEIDEPVALAVDALRQIRQGFGVDRPDRPVGCCLAVVEGQVRLLRGRARLVVAGESDPVQPAADLVLVIVKRGHPYQNGGGSQTEGRSVETVKDEDPTRQSAGAQLEARAKLGERIAAVAPHASLGRRWNEAAMVAIVEDDLKMELRDDVGFRKVRLLIAILDALQVTLGGRLPGAPILLGRDAGNIRVVLRLVMIADEIAAVVAGLAQKPSEDLQRIARIGDTARRRLAVGIRDVVFGRRGPENLAAHSIAPLLDAGEQAFLARHETCDHEIVVRPRVADPRRVFEALRGNEVFGSRQNEGVGVFAIVVLRKSLLRLPGNSRQVEGPTHPERPIPATGAVGQGKRWRYACSVRREMDRHRKRCRAGRRVH
jgi:hypothetical protein